MKITHYGYNSFVIHSGEKKLAIDPGAELYFPRWLRSIIPKQEWQGLTHILVTHGDPDHHWNTDRAAHCSGAAVVCGTSMVREEGGKVLMLGPRDRGLAFTTPVQKLYTVGPGESVFLDGVEITGLPAEHGPIPFRIGPFRKVLSPGPGERIGRGATGFALRLEGKLIVNLGDTLLLEDGWTGIGRPDLLMLPIGGRKVHNTMDEDEALRAVEIMHPVRVIPCHYNCPFFFRKNANPADIGRFRAGAENLGTECLVPAPGESILM